MKKFSLLVLISFVACVSSSPPEKISESDVVKTVEGFFTALDVENDNPDLINDYVTDDFILYEAGNKMNKDEFLEFISGFPVIESDWELSDFRISTDINSAHASLFNKGTFIFQTDSGDVKQVFEWLESAYLVKDQENLKIKFYFSDNIKVEIDSIQ